MRGAFREFAVLFFELLPRLVKRDLIQASER
jgi:hypothetical protein